ncbi:hypothetical protein ENSA5_44800 [Enhygromyxa salina]|uniref:Uncharacterized protein n=1 Tax=Enhygromyxa salina TaxID=215803 RepID=A0A2S9XKE3_9BACT|nr:hypothetical protein [Enhygromyxa salina]PRP93141.1 hypothetical protein ENSA5_44800 [Enhygromyxa salina]
MSITLELLLSFITTITPLRTDTSADLCDIVDTATGVPLRCEPRSDGAPVYDGDVCCDESSCVAASSSCRGDSYYCYLGEARADGAVSCYFEVPDYCEMFSCPLSFESLPLEEPMCCYEGVCWPHVLGSNDCELDDIYWCWSGQSNPDGTVSCFD